VTVDLGPVEKYVSELDSGELALEDELHVPQGLDHEQMRFLVSNLTGMVKRYQRLWEASFSPGHAKTVDKLRELKRLVEDSGHSLGEAWEILE
jgi:hypothetical protein